MLLQFKEVKYTYPCSQKAAVNHLNLSLQAGQRYALIGRNGCGKSTLFRLANGLYRPESGIIRFQGKSLDYHSRSLRELRQKVGLVFQNPEQQLVAATVAEDISYGLGNLGLPQTEIIKRVSQSLREFNLTELADTPINYLSLGQKKRVSLADVMVLEPELLLLDEPTAYLDPSQTQNLLNQLKYIDNRGTTMVIATHNLDFAYSWADWILVMDGGKLVRQGTPEQIFQDREMLVELGLGMPLAIEVLRWIQGEISLSEEEYKDLASKLRQSCPFFP